MLPRLLSTLVLVILVTLPLFANDGEKAGPDWWSLQPLAKPKFPSVKQAEWVRNPLDTFILAKLEEKGLSPARPADRESLIRRVTFDLLGLPPTPKEIDEFLQDGSPRAYEKLIDRLLASPHYGERWARHWLDTARFSESDGFEYDRLRNHAWRYRDYVIKSFNEDKPYSRFIREQLAGDVIPDTTAESIAATGFLVAGPSDQAGKGAVSLLIREKAREDELEDILGTVGQTFLGLTVNCARCHNHKFDPIPARDYYRIKAVFAGVHPGERSLLSTQEQKRHQERSAKFEQQVRDLETQLEKLERVGREIVLKKRGDPAVTEVASLPRPFARWSFEGNGKDSVGSLHLELKDGAEIKNGKLIVNGKGGYAQSPLIDKEIGEKTLEAWVILPNRDQKGGGVISLQTKNGGLFDSIVFAERQPRKWISGSNGFVRSRDVTGEEEKSKAYDVIHLAISYSADHHIQLYRNGVPYGSSYVPEGQKLQIYPAKESQILIGLRHFGGGGASLEGEIEEARFYDRALTAEEVKSSFKAGLQRVSPEEILAALTPEDRKRHQQIGEELSRTKMTRPQMPTEALVYASKAKQPGLTHLLSRGDVELKKEVMSPAGLSFLKEPSGDFGLAEDAPEAERRIKFADWVADPRHPLTWRVMANRLWQHHFGQGIVRTPNDFGFNGDQPSHPELLDYLASEFRDSGGSMKALHRLILLSSTYRQASIPHPKASVIDDDNRLLWRYPLRRLEAETIRDVMLSLSNQLNRRSGGPGFRPFKMENFNSVFYILTDEEGPEFNRRSIYRINVNSAKDPLLDSFDCPDPSVKTPKRTNTTTPLQALSLMNSSFVQRQVKHFAARLQAETPEVSEQVKLAYRPAFGRSPGKEETERAVKFIGEHQLSGFCWALLNSNELLYLR